MSRDVDAGQPFCFHIDSWRRAVVAASVAMLSWFGASANAAIINVPADHALIQGAINAASNGDEIIVAPGTYFESIDFIGKAITLRSVDTSKPELTIIDGTGQPTSVVKCVSGEPSATTLNGFTVQNGSAGTTSGTSINGFGMYIVGSSPNVVNCVFSNNGTMSALPSGIAGYNGAGIAIFNGSSATISTCRFESNSFDVAAPTVGGGIAVTGSNVVLTSCVFAGNAAQLGGGIRIDVDAVSALNNCQFNNNLSNRGGGISFSNCGGSITNCTFMSNIASLTDFGGGIAVENSNVHVEGSTATKNVAGVGGGMAIQNGNLVQPSPTIVNSIFLDNTAALAGGGIDITRAAPLIDGCTIEGNNCLGNTTTAHGGGGLRIFQGGPTIVNSLVKGNTAVARGGGIYVTQFFSLTQVHYSVVSNCIVLGNIVNTVGAGAGIQGAQASANTVAPMRVSNTIVRGNGGGPNVVLSTNMHPGWILFRNNNIEGAIVGAFQGSNNIDADPMFVDAKNGDYHVLDASPGIDAGINTDLVRAEIEVDFGGAARIVDFTNVGFASADMGIFEQQSPNASRPAELPLPYVYWHFNTFGGSSPITADIGSATINTSTWGGTVAIDPVGAFFDINAVNGTAAGTALQLTQGTGGNGTSIYLNLSMTGRENLKVSFVTKRSHNNSFDNGAWAWSVDGSTFTTMAGVNTSPTTTSNIISMLQSADFSAVTALNDAPDVTLRYTLSRNAGAPLADRYVSLDNLQINTTPIIITGIPGDVTGNGIVDVDDLLAVINAWGPCLIPGDCPADIAPAGPPAGNDIVDVDDLLMVINNWTGS